jgi:predicted acyl esterase
MVLGRGLAVLACAFALACAPANAVTKTTTRVPVTQPDEYGLPVALDIDVYVPDGATPAGGWPLIEVFHGGASNKDNAFDAGHARFFAEHGYASLIYSQRGQGGSDGQVAVAGPKEMRDLFDVSAWALAHYPLEGSRIALTGYSQGGLHTNLGQVWSTDPTLNPYGIRFQAIEPGNTPDYVFQALVDHGVVKLSYGAGLLGTYYKDSGGPQRVAPEVSRWVATAAADQPALYGGDLCDTTGHDTPTSTMKADLAVRSVGCFADRVTVPALWSQAFDDGLFPSSMAVAMFHRLPNADNRLYLDMGGHAAPAQDPSVDQSKLADQLAFFDHVLRGAPLSLPKVTYWTRRPEVAVPSDAYKYPANAWFRQTAGAWPPQGTRTHTWQLGADGRAVPDGAAAGSMPLSPVSEDERDDPVAKALLSATPLGTSPADTLPATADQPFVAAFATAPLKRTAELDGAPGATLQWTPLGPDSQLVLKVFDQAPDGTLTLLSRGVAGVRGATPGRAAPVALSGNDFSARIGAGHRLVAWVSAGDLGFYKPYPDGAGGTLSVGPGSTLSVPMRTRIVGWPANQ